MRPMTRASSSRAGSASHCHHMRPAGPYRCRRSGIQSRTHRSGRASYQPSTRDTVWREKAQ